MWAKLASTIACFPALHGSRLASEDATHFTTHFVALDVPFVETYFKPNAWELKDMLKRAFNATNMSRFAIVDSQELADKYKINGARQWAVQWKDTLDLLSQENVSHVIPDNMNILSEYSNLVLIREQEVPIGVYSYLTTSKPLYVTWVMKTSKNDLRQNNCSPDKYLLMGWENLQGDKHALMVQRWLGKETMLKVNGYMGQISVISFDQTENETDQTTKFKLTVDDLCKRTTQETLDEKLKLYVENLNNACLVYMRGKDVETTE